MLAAIYARKSTEQPGVPKEELSVTRQIEHSREYAARKGWTVADAHVYVDDGISGAEFVKRDGLNALLAALGRRAPFDVLIISEDSRLGREALDTAGVMRQIIEAGVRLFAYLDDREITLGSAMDKLLLSIRSFQSEAEREQGGKRTHDAMRRKAAKGHVVGGRLFGYDNVRQPDGTVGRRINKGQAAIVRRIFELYADGQGFKRIAEALNQDGLRGPRGTP
jgi:site-specific DNA recombinase